MDFQIRESLKFICEHYYMGMSFSQCLRGVHKIFEGSQQKKFLSFLFTSMLVSFESGAGAMYILDRIKEKVSDQIELRRKLKVSTAQMRLQALVILLSPVFLVIIIGIISPNNLLFFIHTNVGRSLLIVMTSFYGLAIYFLRRIIKIM